MISTIDYNPMRPWVYKQRTSGSIAANVFWYIDDDRLTATTTWKYWLAMRKVCSTLIFYGLQDRDRK